MSKQREADTPLLPSEVSDHVGWFDRFASGASSIVSRAPFFAACVVLIFVWAPTVTFLEFDTWQLIINTITTIITFLLVALLQNAQTRGDQATQHKLNAMAQAQASTMEFLATYVAEDEDARLELDCDVEELRHAVGLEQRESA